MKFYLRLHNIVVTALIAMVFSLPSWAQDQTKLDVLFERLAQPELADWEAVEREIWQEWSKSGSASMDLLLQRGREAMTNGDPVRAIEHFTALIDHAPDFAEGWNARATAYFTIEEFALSIADIQQTLALNPRHFGALQGLGRILEQVGDEENALKALQAAVAIHPHREGLKEAIERLEREVSGRDI